MPAKGKKKQLPRTTGDQRHLSTQQVILYVISIVIILAMVLSFVITL